MKIILLKALIFFTGYFAHPVHVSMCNLEFNTKESVIAVKLFSDDFETVLENNFHSDIVLPKSDEEPNRKYITEYINTNLQLFINNKGPLTLSYDYSEKDSLSIWLYFKTDILPSSGPLKIVNTLMLDLWEDQTNLLIVNHNGEQKGLEFNDHITELEIVLK